MLILLTHVVSARHIVGGEMFYECLGPGSVSETRNYRITMKIYRDCDGMGADFDNPARIGIYSHINGVYAFVRMIDVTHLAVIDLVLEQGAGLEVIRRCRADPTGGKVVVFSSYATPGVREHCLELGADAVFDKHAPQEFIAWCSDLTSRENSGP